MPDLTIMAKYVPHYDTGHCKLSIVVKMRNPSDPASPKSDYVFSVLGSRTGGGCVCQKRVFDTQHDQRRFCENGQFACVGSHKIWHAVHVMGQPDEVKILDNCLSYLPKAFHAFDKEYIGKAIEREDMFCIGSAESQFRAEMSLCDRSFPPDHDILLGEDINLYKNRWNAGDRTQTGFLPREWAPARPDIMGNDKWKRIYEDMQNRLTADTLKFRHVDESRYQYTEPVTIEGEAYVLQRYCNRGSRALFCLVSNPESGPREANADQTDAGSVQGGGGGEAPVQDESGRSRIYMARVINARGLTEFAGGGVYRIKDGNRIILNGKTYVTIINDRGEERVLDQARIRYDYVYAIAPPEGEGEAAVGNADSAFRQAP